MEKILASIVLITLIITGYIVYKSRQEDNVIFEDGSSWTASVVKSKPDPNIPVLVSTLSVNTPQKQIIKNNQNEKNKLNINGKQYKLVKFNNNDISSEENYTVLFQENKISGKICNIYNGEYRLDARNLYTDKIVSTKIACASDAGIYENTFFEMFRSGSGIAEYGEGLLLSDAKGNTFKLKILNN